MKCVGVYKELYHQEPFDVAFCPYRISPLGAHIDHQYGKINGLAIDKGIHMAYHPKQNGVVELQSLNFPKRAQFFVSAVPEEKQGDWADHLRGAAKMLGEKYRLKVGLSGIIEGSLPIGGLSSSASVIICFLSALCKVNGIHLEPMEMILTAKAAENQYVGVSCGKLDQSCEVLSKKNHLLYLDTKDDSYELIPTSEKMKPYKVAIFFSGLERSLKNSKYNLRQDECKAAAYALMGYAGRTMTPLQTPASVMCRMRCLKPIKTGCLNCGAGVRNIITASLLVLKRAQNCGVKVIWRATVSLFLKAENPLFIAMSVDVMN